MKSLLSKSLFCLLAFIIWAPGLSLAQESTEGQGRLLFADDFDRNEDDDSKEQLGNGWGTNSKRRAAGNKQCDLKDGALYIRRHEVADHGVSVTHPAEFTDGAVSVRFMLENEDDKLGLNFADMKFKEVHAGHLFKVVIGTKRTELVDLKTGIMDREIRDLRKANKLSADQKAMLKTKAGRFPHKLQTGKWYSALATIDEDNLSVSIDGHEIGSFSSPGIAHPTKRMLRIAVEKNVVIDDLKIFSHDKSDVAPIVTAARGKENPLKVLLVAGGCCHDYAAQTKILKSGIEERIHADVTVVYNENKSTKATFEIYESDDWANGYDVVLHDECAADVTDKPYIERILAAHRNGIPAVNLHCAMHSYRFGDFRKPVEEDADNAGWYKMLGLQSSGHGPHSPIDVKYVDGDNPVTKGLESWTTIDEELYNNVRMFGGIEILATGSQTQAPRKKALQKNPDAKPKSVNAVIVWTNLYGPNKTKIFSTSLGHNNETVGDDRYLDLVVRGLLWTTGNLTENGEPVASLAR